MACHYNLAVCVTTEWKILKFIFSPGIQVAGVKVNCVSAVTLYYLGCQYIIFMVHIDMTLGICEYSYELNPILKPL